MMKVIIFATHPIQYQVPIYRELTKYLELKVIYLLKQTKKGQADAGFGVEFEWDIPLTTGYQYDYLPNLSKSPSSSNYNGIILLKKDIDALFIKEKPDAIIVHGWFPKGIKQIINYAHKKNITSFCRGDSTLLMTNNPLKKLLKEVYIRSILKKIDYFLYVGKENKKYYKHYGIKDNRLFPAYHCINTPFFQRYFLRNNEEPSNQFVRIGFSGKFIEKKQPLLLLEAVNKSMYKEKIKLIFIGDGPLKGDIKTFSLKHNLNILFTGFLNQTEIVQKGYCLFDTLVLPSNQNETWGLVVNEVMTGGIPCIVSNKVGCHSDLIIEHKTGYVFEANNADDLAMKINEFVKCRLNNYDYKTNVLKHIHHYSLTETVNGYLNALNSIKQ